jgi:hypothetical protein
MIQRFLITVICWLAAVVVPTLSMAQSSIEQLLRHEQKGLGRVASRLIEQSLSPATALGAITYSRDWLATHPEARGGAQWACLSEALYFEARGESVKG